MYKTNESKLKNRKDALQILNEIKRDGLILYEDYVWQYEKKDEDKIKMWNPLPVELYFPEVQERYTKAIKESMRDVRNKRETKKHSTL